MRGWLLVRLAGLDVEENVIPLEAGPSAALKNTSPTGLVPYLEHDGAKIWDSLAIAEYCAELATWLWPVDRIGRAHARSVSAEMHAGFRALRMAMPMNLGRDYPGLGQNPECLADIARIDQIFSETRARFGADGRYLFGATFGAADAMFAPVVARFITYAAPVSAATKAYCAAVRAHPLVSQWYESAAREPTTWLLEKYESLA
jgi:glutathione S-transferase